MKTRILMIAMGALVTGVSYTACTPSEQKVDEANAKVQEAQRNLDSAKAEAKAREEEWMNYKTTIESKATENDKKIAELRAQMKKEKKDVQAKYEKEISDLEQKNKGIRQKLTEFKNESKTDWDSLKVKVDRDLQEFDHDVDGLTDALKNFTKKSTK